MKFGKTYLRRNNNHLGDNYRSTPREARTHKPDGGGLVARGPRELLARRHCHTRA